MAKARNLSCRAIYLNLNSTNLRLSPGEVSEDFHEVELKNNSKFEKLLLQRAIALETEDVAPKDAALEAAPAKAAEQVAGAGEAAPAGAGDDSDPRSRARKKT
jgi:hypothetical protein